MWELFISNKFEIPVLIISFLLLISILLPVERFLSRFLEISVGKKHVVLLLLFTTIVLFLAHDFTTFLIGLPVLIFSLFTFLFGFISNRRYIYSLSLAFLILTPVFLIIKLENIADFLSQGCYLLLILGVLRDVFYERLFD